MDVVTHGLASFATARVLIPRAHWSGWLTVVVAGTIAELDGLSTIVGPSAYFTWRHTYTHSFLASLLFAALLLLAYRALAKDANNDRLSTPALLSAILFAEGLHLAMDAGQSDGVALLWPFSAKRFALDWISAIDPWILVVLIAALVIPMILQLVSSEIGAKEKQPHGRIGAIIGLFVLFLSIGSRAYFHSRAIGLLQNRMYNNEQPLHVAAFPESGSLVTWHGIVETERTFREIRINAMPGAWFNSENGARIFKPDASPVLDKARNTQTARKFLGVARFPKATVEQTDTGTLVSLRDLRYAALAETRHEVASLIHIGLDGSTLEQRFVWANTLGRN